MIARRRLLHVLSTAPLLACSSSAAEAPNDAATDAAPSGETGADASPVDSSPVDASTEAATCPGIYYGSVEDFRGSTWRFVGVGDDRVIVARDDSGLYAYSATCTHEKCFVELQDAFGNTRCPCHGATFDGDGLVTAGPATSPLPHYRVNVCGRRVYVDRADPVPTHTRTVP
jgi:Rieske Fe-S protein